jgi:hypothetical protein
MSERGKSVLATLTALAGWGGLVYLVTQTTPQPYRWLLFLALLLAALTSSTFLLLRYLYRRFDRPTTAPALRQSLWVGLFVVLCAWLQIYRILDWAAALLLAAVFGLVEGYLLSHE